MRLKVCGVRTMPMLQACQDLSIPYIGFNFVPTSARKVDLSTAHHLSHAYTGKKVGVFKNQSVEAIIDTARVVDLNIIQLHGAEAPNALDQLRQHWPEPASVKIWKVVTVEEHTPDNILQLYSRNADLILFDGSNPGTGQTIGETKKLKTLVSVCETLKLPYGLAGGINATTAPALLDQFETAALFDTASGVETMGQFDKIKLETLLSILEDV